MKTLTHFQARALTILALAECNGGLRVRDFARAMWPDSACWRKVYKCGVNGASRGQGMQLLGGSYLARLRKRGLSREIVSDQLYGGSTHVPSPDGRAALKAYNAKRRI